MNIAYWIYGRLGVHIGRSDDDVVEALNEYADEAFKQGRAAVTPDLVAAVLKEHKDARDFYVAMRF